MFTQNGVSDTISTTRLKTFLRSMRLRVFLIVMLSGCTLWFVCGVFFKNYIEDYYISSKTEQVRDYTEKLTTKMVSQMYTIYPSQSVDIGREMDLTASLYDGRIVVTDYNLMVIYDSYGIENGKTLIAPETVNAIHRIPNEYISKTRRTVELTLPINDDVMSLGVIVFTFSIDDCLETVSRVDHNLRYVSAVMLVIMFCFSVFAARILSNPFKKISDSLHHVSEGYTTENVNIGGFSEMDKISDSFNEMLARFNQIEQSRQEFVSNVSHELKTPITSIKVLADSLIEQPDAPVEMYREFMMDINEEIDRESKIIADLLDLVKLDRTSGDMHVAEVSINELLDQIIKRVKPLAEKASVEIIFETYREVVAEVDEVKLSLAIMNLIENGIKYNRENGLLKISLNADHKYFMVTVSDNGIGIPEEEAEHIFERFYRVDKMRSRQTGGTGLGLAITKSVVVMHHGAIKVDSTLGEGSTFVVKIPLSYIPDFN